MDALAALADPARWRLVALLAERPRSVGVLAQLAQARQPQTTKHLQILERAGIVTSQRTGQRRIYALHPTLLRELATTLNHLADTAEHATAHQTHQRHTLTIQAERLAAHDPGWADGRTFHFHRTLAATPDQVWRHLTDTTLLTRWWTPDDLRISELVFDARPGGRIIHEYRDIEDLDGSDLIAGRAIGTVDDVQPGRRLTYRLSPLLPDGSHAFTSHLDLRLHPTDTSDGTGTGTDLTVDYRITDSTIDSADFIAGIELGFGQSLDTLTTILATQAHPTGGDAVHDHPAQDTGA